MHSVPRNVHTFSTNPPITFHSKLMILLGILRRPQSVPRLRDTDQGVAPHCPSHAENQSPLSYIKGKLSCSGSAFSAPVTDLKVGTNQAVIVKSNGTVTTVQTLPSATATILNDAPIQSVAAVQLVPLTQTSAIAPTTVQVASQNLGPTGRSNDDQIAQGRANELSDALGLMSSVLAPRFMQPGQIGASLTPAASGPAPAAAAPAVQQQPIQQQMPFQQAPQQPMMNTAFQPQFAQQQPAFLPQQQMLPQQQAFVPQQNLQPMMMPIQQQQPAYGMMGQGLLGQGMPQLQMRSNPGPQAVAGNGFVGGPEQRAFQPQQQLGNVQGQLPTFNGAAANGQGFPQQQQQFVNNPNMG
ncbi:hypothetical protein BV898_01524 [Hypsibius exemplaris]|uniref:Uncharacterized protein n=1 Tax=Hypsibius exemplaris TaxID=2072580 RepID=A0A1W0XAM7_HYPEX|nr:hypothetical protein BV898_01524 [Hypsibius exemplaris]